MNRPPDAAAPTVTTGPAAPGTSPAASTGAIHDIGYRHHDGPRLGRGYIRRSLFVESVRGAYGLGRTGRAKVMPMLLLAGMCLPALVIVVVTAVVGADELVAGYTSYVLNLQLVIAIYVAGQAPVSVSRDLRFGVMPLYLSRPLERADYVVAKFGAMTAAVFLLVALPLTILFAGALVAGLPLSEQVPDYLRSLAGGVIVALLLAGIALAIASSTPRRGIGVAAIITVLMVLAAVQGAAQEIALDRGSMTLAGYLGMLSPFALVDGIQSGLLGAEGVLRAPPPGTSGAVVFALVAGLTIAATFAFLQLRYRKVSVS